MRVREVREGSLGDCWEAASMSSWMIRRRSQSMEWRGGMRAEEEGP
jgi:hypothetical protein